LVKNHAEAEFQILKTIDLFLPIADIVHQHHERIDGSGYPLGLKGDDILMEARVIAVADVVEAMLSDRPHRPALSVDSAMNEIKAGKGTLYDPNAVDACVRLLGEGKFRFDGEETATPEATPSAA
jgi:HD-GYP domain-containing protein (c-di-GMP phosphodiesterase class II)